MVQKLPLYLSLSFGALLLSSCGSSENTASDAASSAGGGATAQAAVALSGETIYNQCKACHTINKGGDAVIGPNLWGIMGSGIAVKSDFSYSKALSAKGGKWDAASMNAFIQSPQGFAPGNRMSFSGIKDADKRKALIEYMAKQSD